MKTFRFTILFVAINAVGIFTMIAIHTRFRDPVTKQLLPTYKCEVVNK